MAKAGRPRKPKPTMMEAQPGLPDCPEILGEVGKAEWVRVTSELDRHNLLSKIDRGLIAALCEAWEEFHTYTLEVRKVGPVCYTDKGNAIQNPVLGAKNRAAERYAQLSKRLGISPHSRQNLKSLAGEDEADEFAAFAGIDIDGKK